MTSMPGQSPTQPTALDLAQYSAVATRRGQWDQLLWQVPTISLAAQAFLFTTSLSPEVSAANRILAAILSLVMTYICLQLMHRHRAGELTDSAWLKRFEERFNAADPTHGPKFRELRAERIHQGILDDSPFNGVMSRLANWRSFTVWVGGLLLFGVASVIVLVAATMELLNPAK